jgi:hypothetical protein
MSKRKNDPEQEPEPCFKKNKTDTCNYSGEETLSDIENDIDILSAAIYGSDNSDVDSDSKIINRCICCNIDIGANNPRQYCNKTYCPEDVD